MRWFARSVRRYLIPTVAAVLVAPLVSAAPAAAEDPDWRAEVAKIPVAEYTRDARASIGEAGARIRPHLGDDLGESRLEPTLADLDTRYFDGARFNSAADAEAAFDNVAHLESYIKGRVSGGDKPTGEALQAYVDALVGSLTGVRLLADASIQDAEATIGPFRTTGPPPGPAPPGLAEAFADLDTARSKFAAADDMLLKGNPEPAAVHSAAAQDYAFRVLTRFGITYTGDHDADGVVDVVELRLGASPLLIDSDSDGLTDRFEIHELIGWTMPNRADTDGDGTPDSQEDTDNDGLTNLREQELGTSPTQFDTDGDGVSDGAEIARGTNPLVADPRTDPPLGGGAPPIIPEPNLTDTDGDGLIDDVEGEALTSPTNVDSDGDGLSDGTEVNDWGINPLAQDTDGDSLRDDYETVHAEDQGLDPGNPDQQISKWTYVTDFLLGMFAGDFAPRDSMAWLAGNLCSGALSFIPVVGWIIGGAADIRDTIAGLIHGDWVGAGLSILGVVPYVGDAVAIPGKAARFVVRYFHRLVETLRFVTRYDKIPDAVKNIALELILGATYTYLLGDDGGLSVTASRFTATDILRLTKGYRTKWKKIEEAMQLPNHQDGPPLRAGRNAPDGETILREFLNQNCAKRNVPTPDFPRTGQSHRRPDCIEIDPFDDTWTLHEVKTGVSKWTADNIDECLKDAWIPTPEAKKIHKMEQIKGVHWHFIAHEKHNSIGIDDSLLQCLRDNNIKFTIHAPGAA